ncbi:hypothetical protein IJI70_01565 [Candidatus Saccharibacteria bacterium]|nr:hypothetical protein [Candidatus Saccharibacteria bacterium]
MRELETLGFLFFNFLGKEAREVGLTQIYTLDDEVGFELNDGTVVKFKYGEHQEGLIGLLARLRDELGRVPTFEDALNYPKMPHPNTFAFYFGSFEKATERVGGVRIERIEKGSEDMSRRKWTHGEIISLVIKKEKELGHFPTQKDLNDDPELPNYQTIANKFGGLRELKVEVEERKKKLEAMGEKSLETPEEAAVQAILDLITPPKNTEGVSESVPEVASEEASEVLEASGVSEEVVSEVSEEVVESEPIAEEEASEGSYEPEVVSGDVEETEEREEDRKEGSGNGEAKPIQTTVEVKNDEGKKVVRIVLSLEISFPT